VFSHLQIYDRRERWIVGAGDLLLPACAWMLGPWRAAPKSKPPRRILLLRLERIGDLLMTLGAFDTIRARAPEADIHLVVGSWNASLARLIPGISSFETLDVPWLARHDEGATLRELVQRAATWRTRGFNLAINFEPDIRSNLLLALSGAPERVGYRSGGGGALLTRALDYLPRSHTATNAADLVDAALPTSGTPPEPKLRYQRLLIPEEARQTASRLLAEAASGGRLVGVHASGGRLVKEWPAERFAEVGTRLAHELDATIVLTGATADRPLIDRVKAALAPDVTTIDVSGSIDLPVLAGVLERLALFVTADTGPMHLAAAVGTPLVALFGPSDPQRYGPLTDRARVVTTDLWCRPCNRVRRPPERCTGRIPDCLTGIDVARVSAAATDLLANRP
jgi:lipopolysaccharide heptosyltransferase II